MRLIGRRKKNDKHTSTPKLDTEPSNSGSQPGSGDTSLSSDAPGTNGGSIITYFPSYGDRAIAAGWIGQAQMLESVAEDLRAGGITPRNTIISANRLREHAKLLLEGKFL